MKVAVSKICGLSDSEILNNINVDGFEDVRLNRSNNPISAQSIFYQLYNKPIFESTQNVEEALDALEWCKDIPNIVFGNPGLRNISGNKEIQLAKDFFNEYTNRYNNIISIEPLHYTYGTNFINTLDDAVKFISELNNPRVKINLDLGSCSIDKENIHDINLINHVHISGPYLQAIGNIDYYKKAMYTLNELGYNNYISLESLDFYRDIDAFKEII